jgi:ceramide glucosyltransferase
LSTALDFVVVALLCGSAAGACYMLVAYYAVRGFAADDDPTLARRRRPPVSLLKPICGLEPGLYRNLRSFCEQDYPQLQTVFAAREPTDPAIAVARQLSRDLPEADIAIVAGGTAPASNLKVANLMRAAEVARHEVLVISDSDMRVEPGYLDAVTAPLAEPDVGLVTCLYVGRPVGGLWSQLGAMFINHEFLPSVLVGRMTGAGQGCFGATIALRRETLERVGGFAAFRNRLADDYALGEAVRSLGKRVVLSRHLVEDIVHEPLFKTLFLHELRWARTIRAITPGKYAASAITRPVGLAALATLLTGFTMETLWAFWLAFAARALAVSATSRALGLRTPPLWLLPVRELLSLLVLVCSFLGSRVTWRGNDFHAEADGRLVPADSRVPELAPFVRQQAAEEAPPAELPEPLEPVYRRS